MAQRTPDGPPPPPTVQRVRIRYAKRGRLRFTSHRDFARALERALRRAGVPMAYSAGFTPHPKVSYVGAAPTGVASEAEYLELGLAQEVDLDALRAALDDALPDGLDVLDVVRARSGPLTERIEASHWRIRLQDLAPDAVRVAVRALLAAERVDVQRLTKDGRRTLDARAPIVAMAVSEPDRPALTGRHAILDVVVRQVSPAVRPDDVLAALRIVGDLALEAPPSVVRLAQGPLDERGRVGDPLTLDRAQTGTSP